MTNQRAQHDPKAAAFKHFFNVILIGLSAHDLTRKYQSCVDEAEAETDGEVEFICYIR
jgi:hypothetical protein